MVGEKEGLEILLEKKQGANGPQYAATFYGLPHDFTQITPFHATRSGFTLFAGNVFNTVIAYAHTQEDELFPKVSVRYSPEFSETERFLFDTVFKGLSSTQIRYSEIPHQKQE